MQTPRSRCGLERGVTLGRQNVSTQRHLRRSSPELKHFCSDKAEGDADVQHSYLAVRCATCVDFRLGVVCFLSPGDQKNQRERERERAAQAQPSCAEGPALASESWRKASHLTRSRESSAEVLNEGCAEEDLAPASWAAWPSKRQARPQGTADTTH